MIGKVTQGSGALGFIKYDTDKDKAEILYKNNLYGETAADWANEMRAVSDQRNVKNDTFHISLSLDKEHATNEQWIYGAKAALEKLGFDISKTQFLLTRHGDNQHDHTHLVVNRIMLDGSIVSDSNIRYRTHEATRAAELASGLQQFDKTQEISKSGKMHELRSSIGKALQSSSSYADFKTNLQKTGIEVIENRSKTTAYISGISYKTIESGQTWKGSAVGKEYSYSNVNKTLGSELATENHIDTAGSSAGSGFAGGGISLGGSSNLSKNLTKGRESLGLTVGQKDRIRKESSREL